ncbi:hypothetical protein WJX75_003243 [Coccomyxa subellipsoidea]|uniref:Uncharacterized protein n=1 Tax=Coccomyxa subellipsoidea TaxID=248742 RepID=A0ABR2Z3E3_9CHLO
MEEEVDACAALALDPDFAEGYYWRACARCDRGYVIGAAADMRTCIEKLQDDNLKSVAHQWLEYMEACLSWDLGMGAAEASAAHEAIGARIARDATAVASFLRWQRYSQLLACQRAALPAQDASPEETCTTTHPREDQCLVSDLPPSPTTEAASSQLSSLPDEAERCGEATAPPAVDDPCTSPRIEAGSKKAGTPPDTPRSLVNGLHSEPSTVSSSPGTPSDDSSD